MVMAARLSGLVFARLARFSSACGAVSVSCSHDLRNRPSPPPQKGQALRSYTAFAAGEFYVFFPAGAIVAHRLMNCRITSGPLGVLAVGSFSAVINRSKALTGLAILRSAFSLLLTC